jgi:hypothetical protein
VPSYAAATQPYKAIDYDNINANKAKIRTSLTIASAAGTLADCNSNGVNGCVTTATYKSADLTNLAAGNVKRGVSIAGTTGEFPSSAYPLPRYSDGGATTNTVGDGGITADLTNFITQLTTDGSFEFWDETGIRRTGAGDSDIVDANVVTGIDFENLSVEGSAPSGAAPDARDLRAGITVGSVTGELRTNCRNLANTTLWDQGLPVPVTVSSGVHYRACVHSE